MISTEWQDSTSGVPISLSAIIGNEFISTPLWASVTIAFLTASLSSRPEADVLRAVRGSDAFKITEDSSELLTDFFRKYYFCPYSDYYMDPVCLVYSSFTSLNAEQGTSIYDFLSEEDYALKQASELIEDSRHKKRIDKIVAQTG